MRQADRHRKLSKRRTMATADDELLRVMFDLSRVLLTEADVRGDLERVVSVAEATVPGCDGASVTVIVKGQPRTEAATDRVVLEADLIQYRSREGPCLSAIATGEPVRVGLIAADQRFVRFAAGAAHAGVLSVLSLPVSVGGQVVAGLNLYSRSAHGFDPTSEMVGSVLAAQAGAAVAKSQAVAASQRAADRIQDEVDDRAEVRQAEGMLMVLYQCNAEQASLLLANAAASDHETVTAVARRVVTEARSTRLPPGGAAPGVRPPLVADHASVSALLGVYALDGCDEVETAAIETHLAECFDCATEAALLKDAVGWLGVSEAKSPPAHLRARLLGEADPGRSDPP
jgi:GAF domain-containing protein